MGLIAGLMGNASELDVEKLQRELEPILAPDEKIALGFKVIRDQFLFTDKRFMVIDKQGVTGRKVEYMSVPYKAIAKFSVETAGHFDMDAELKVWVSSNPDPIKKELKRGSNITAIQKALAAAVL